MSGTPPVLRRGAALAAVAFAVATLIVGIDQGAPPQFLVADTVGGLVFIGTGAIAWERRPDVRSGPLLVASGVLWFVGSYAPTSLTPHAWLGFTFERYYDVVLALFVLSFPAAPIGRPAKVALWTLAGAFMVRSAARLVISHPGAPENPIALIEDPVLFDRTQLATSALIVVAALWVAVLALRRLRGATGASRRVLRPVVAAGVVAALVAAFDALELIAFVLTGQPVLPLPEPWLEISSWTIIAAITLVPLGFLAGSLRMRMSHGVIAPLAVELDRRADTGQLERALRQALGDPSLELLVFDGESAGWRDAGSRPTDRPIETSDRAVTMLRRDAGEPIAAVLHDPALREDPGLVAAATAVLRLGVENERLASDLRRQLEEVRASRARVIEAAEQERSRIERDLHDGAQQRLIGVALTLQRALSAARREAPHAAFVQQLDETSDELKSAIDEVRELARGIHPTLLTEEGLAVAIPALARRSSLPVDVDISLDRRLPPAVEAAGYYVVAEALTNVARHSRARNAGVRVTLDDGRLEVVVTDDGHGGTDPSRGSGLRGLADRLDAVSGTLDIDSPVGGGTRLRAVIPCG